MTYSVRHINLLYEALEDNRQAAEVLASENKNLYVLESALRGNIEAMNWLFENDKILAAFDAGVGGNKSAIRLLVKMKEFEWAAVANFIKGDKKALEWLKSNKLNHLIRLAFSIKKVL